MQIAGTGFDHLGISSTKWQSHSASSAALSSAMNSDSIVDLAIQVYLEDFHEIVAPPSVKTYPLVDFESPICITVSFQYSWISHIVQPMIMSIS